MNKSSVDLFTSDSTLSTTTSNVPDPTPDYIRPTDGVCHVPKLHRVILMNMTIDEYVLKYYGDVYLDTETMMDDPNIDIFEEIHEDRLFAKRTNRDRGDGSGCKHALVNRLIYEINQLGENDLYRMNDVIIGAVYHFEKFNETDQYKSNFLTCKLTSEKIRIDLSKVELSPVVGAFVTVIGWINIKFLNARTKVHYIDVQCWNDCSESEMFHANYYFERLNRYKIFDDIKTQSYEFDNSLLLDCISIFNDTFVTLDFLDVEEEVDVVPGMTLNEFEILQAKGNHTDFNQDEVIITAPVTKKDSDL